MGEGNSQKLKHQGNRSKNEQDVRSGNRGRGGHLLRVLRAGRRVNGSRLRRAGILNPSGLKRGGRSGHRNIVIRAMLSKREREVLTWLSRGKTSWEISIILNISERTVNYHVGNIMRKLDVSSRLQAVSEAAGEGYCEDS